ncbi:hypothetical protein NKI44_30900 [Mesorhizobium sp. M0614]|uniref:hypothetical protein n=1 Tax=Mesorhizobium sp. M0614 TaxID=2956970 RepID=UPI003338B1A7
MILLSIITHKIPDSPRSTPRTLRRTAPPPAEKGVFAEAIGRSRGGRTTKIHALTDAAGRPRVLMIAPGNLHDVMMAEELLLAAGPV